MPKGNNTEIRHRVIVVGAGFSGLVAARELEAAGVDVSIYEARNRIGGRAWTDHRMGYDLEMGATWVHWMQPFVWSEITRYDQKIYASPYPTTAYWVGAGKAYTGSKDELMKIFYPLQHKIFEGSREFFPYPHDPFYILNDKSTSPELLKRFLAADTGSVLDCLRDAGYSQEEIDLADSYWSGASQGPTATCSPMMAKHWAALSDHRGDLLDEQTLGFKLAKGMKGLYTSIASDIKATINLNTAVAAIEHTDVGVRVTLADGTVDMADAVIVTVPIGALKNIELSPALNEDQQNLVREGSNSVGCKIWIKVKGRHEMAAAAPGNNPISLMQCEYFGEDDTTVLVGFGADHEAIDLTSVESAQKAMNVWSKDFVVVDCTGHDWVADKWSGQTWATLKSGQFFKGWNLFSGTDTRLRFAGADWARGWNGVVVDGAIESGITTARRLVREFRAGLLGSPLEPNPKTTSVA